MVSDEEEVMQRFTVQLPDYVYALLQRKAVMHRHPLRLQAAQELTHILEDWDYAGQPLEFHMHPVQAISVGK